VRVTRQLEATAAEKEEKHLAKGLVEHEASPVAVMRARSTVPARYMGDMEWIRG